MDEEKPRFVVVDSAAVPWTEGIGFRQHPLRRFSLRPMIDAFSLSHFDRSRGQ